MNVLCFVSLFYCGGLVSGALPGFIFFEILGAALSVGSPMKLRLAVKYEGAYST